MQFRPDAGSGEIRRRLGLSPATFVIGSVARLVPVKNHAMLVEATAIAAGKGLDCALVLIGEGPLREALQQQAETLGIGQRVHFWGLDADVARLYPELDVFVLSSNLEGTSISLLEAMASATCPVATAVGGNMALIEDGVSGVLVPAREPGPLAAALVAIAERSVATTRAGHGCAQTRGRTVRRGRDGGRLRADLLYDDVVSARRRAPGATMAGGHGGQHAPTRPQCPTGLRSIVIRT